MKTQFTLSVEEAEQRLAISMSDQIPYQDNDVSVKIVPEVRNDNLPLQQASKIALIKLVRTLAEDLRMGRIQLTNCETYGPRVGEKYMGLADAKSYVEKYLKDTSPQI